MFKSDHIKNIFTWKKKIIFEKDKPSGAYEVTIELRILQNILSHWNGILRCYLKLKVPARHARMTGFSGEQELLPDNDVLKKEVKTTTETLLVKTNEDLEDDKLDNKKVNGEVWRNEKFFDIPVTRIWKKNPDDDR